MLLAANIAMYEVLLLGLFVMASGITVLQVAANPLSAALGSPERSHFRLTFSQAFNSLGTVLGPILGAQLFLKGIEVKAGTSVTAAARAGSFAGIDRAFFWNRGCCAATAERDRPARDRGNNRRSSRITVGTVRGRRHLPLCRRGGLYRDADDPLSEQ
jgi:hypothetical protein